VLPCWEGADEAQSGCSFSNLIRYGSGMAGRGRLTAGPQTLSLTVTRDVTA
jgi:hypothetical protein